MNKPSPTTLLLIRHAEVEAAYQQVFGGRVDMDISPRGHEQAAALADYLSSRKVDALFASPMKRVQQTLAPYLAKTPLRPTVLPELREVDFGDWTGLGWDAVQAKFGVSAYSWLEQLERDAMPNAEKISAYRARVAAALETVRKTPSGGTAAVFCHGGVIRMMLALMLELPFTKTSSFAVDYASLAQVALKPDRNEIQLLNFAPWRERGCVEFRLGTG